jgi:hypothetical protein
VLGAHGLGLGLAPLLGGLLRAGRSKKPGSGAGRREKKKRELRRAQDSR